jgi:hypothetical protein
MALAKQLEEQEDAEMKEGDNTNAEVENKVAGEGEGD